MVLLDSLACSYDYDPITGRISPRCFPITTHPPPQSYFGRHANLTGDNAPPGLRLKLTAHDAGFQLALEENFKVGELYIAVVGADVKHCTRILTSVDKIFAAFVEREKALAEAAAKVNKPPAQAAAEAKAAAAKAKKNKKAKKKGDDAEERSRTWSCADCFGGTPLTLLAAGKDAAGVVTALLDHGFDPLATSETGECIMHRAARSPGGDTITQLSKLKSVSLEARDHAGRTALHVACRDGSVAALSALLAAGADVHARATLTGITPLMAAAASGRKEPVAAVLEHMRSSGKREGERAVRTALGQTDATGWQALHHACESGHNEVAEYLAAQGATVGSTPLGLRSPTLLHPNVATSPRLNLDYTPAERAPAAAELEEPGPNPEERPEEKPGSLLVHMKTWKPKADPRQVSPKAKREEIASRESTRSKISESEKESLASKEVV